MRKIPKPEGDPGHPPALAEHGSEGCSHQAEQQATEGESQAAMEFQRKAQIVVWSLFSNSLHEFAQGHFFSSFGEFRRGPEKLIHGQGQIVVLEGDGLGVPQIVRNPRDHAARDLEDKLAQVRRVGNLRMVSHNDHADLRLPVVLHEDPFNLQVAGSTDPKKKTILGTMSIKVPSFKSTGSILRPRDLSFISKARLADGIR